MNIFKHKWFWLVVILFVLLGVFIKKGVVRDRPPSVYYDLKPEILNSLKKDVFEKRDEQAAWRIYAYYRFTKKDSVEKDKWEKIAREIQPTTSTNLNRRNGEGEGSSPAKP